MTPGSLQKNGMLYSPTAVQTEYFSRSSEPDGDSWLDLTGPFIRSTHDARLPDTTSAWEPDRCSAR